VVSGEGHLPWTGVVKIMRGGFEVTPQQAVVVDHVLDHHCTVVSAGAGSGKTYTTVATVLELIDSGNASAEDFALITFTHKAASELRQRIREGLRKRFDESSQDGHWHAQMERLGGAYVGTIHGFCADLLRRYGYDQAIARQAGITFAEALRADVEKEVLEEWTASPMLSGRTGLQRPYEIRDLVDQVYEHVRNVGRDPADVLVATAAQPDDQGKPYRVAMATLVARVHERYTQEKQSDQLIDAHDILVRTAVLLESEPDVAEAIARKRPFVFVDEFQDTDRTQKRLIDALLPHCKGVLVVGDAKQSIYRFRGADVSLITEIAREQGVTMCALSISRRPTRPLLRAQNALFSNMGPRYHALDQALEESKATLDPSYGPTAFRYLSAGSGTVDQTARIDVVGRAIEKMVGEHIHRGGGIETIGPGHIVVLVRSNRDVAAYSEGLLRQGIHARSDYGSTFFELPEIVGVYRVLRMVLDYPTAAPMAEALAVPYLRHLWKPEFEHSILSSAGGSLRERVERTYPNFAQDIHYVRDHLRTDTVSQSLRRVFQTFGIGAYYEAKGDTAALLHLERLRDVARDVFAQEQALTMRQFVDFLQTAILVGREADFAELQEARLPDHIRVMTIHAAKGLEFPVVIIPEVQRPITAGPPPTFVVDDSGLDIQVFPEDSLRDSRTPGFQTANRQRRQHDLDEAMRLLYVAVTRATHSVVLVGSGRVDPLLPDSDYYGWLDEILEARGALEALGPNVVRYWSPS
jgi:DNA helicase-2/ATP-dependent DNA helicase PcrA